MAQTKALVDKLLTQVSSAYIPTGYISEDVLPNIAVKQTTGLLGKYGNEHLRIQNSVMGGRGEARRVEVITRSTQTYMIEAHGLESIVTPDDYRNVELPFRAEEDEVVGLTTALWLGKEKALADVMGSTSIITQNETLAGQAQFSDYTNSNPLGKFKTAFAAVKAGCGVAPNAVAMSWDVYNTLKYHPAILEALGYAQNRAGLLSREDIARAMDVKYLYVSEAAYNTAAKGQTDALASVWGKDLVFYVRPERAAPYQVSLGYYLTYENEGPRKVYKFAVNNPPESTGIIVMDSYDMFLSNVSAAFLYKNAVA